MTGDVAATPDRFGRTGDVDDDARPDPAGPERGAVLVAGPDDDPGGGRQAQGVGRVRPQRAGDVRGAAIVPSRPASSPVASSISGDQSRVVMS